MEIDYDMKKTTTGWNIFDLRIAGIKSDKNAAEGFVSMYQLIQSIFGSQ